MSQQAQRRRKLHTHTHTHTHGCLCKTIISAIFAIATTIPTFATNITDSNKGCTSGNLETSSGSTELEADWQANTVGVTFYSDNTQIGTGTCQYDGTLTLPENDPEKTGYTFNGWKVRRAAAAPQPSYVSCKSHETQQECISDNRCEWYNGYDFCYLSDEVSGYEGCGYDNINSADICEAEGYTVCTDENEDYIGCAPSKKECVCYYEIGL